MPEPLNQRQRDRLVDAAIVVFVIWASLSQFGSEGFGEYEDVATEPGAPGFFLILLTGLSLAWRRQHPWSVMAMASVGSIALVALALVVLGAAPASAHAELIATDPVEGSVLETAPDTVTLTFNEPVRLTSQEIAVYDAAGDEVGSTAGSSGTEVTVDLTGAADLADGIHPNAGGYAKLAAAWHAALRPLLTQTPPR